MKAELITLFVVGFGMIVAGCAAWILMDFIFPHIIIPLIAIHPLIGFLIFILIIMLIYVPMGYVFSVLIEFVVKIGDAESEPNEKRYESAREKAEEAKKLAKESMKEAVSMLNDAKLYGYISNTAALEAMLALARSAFHDGRYEVAIKRAEICKKFIMKWEGRAKPEIEVDMPLKEYKRNYWKRTKFILKNRGEAHARDVEIELSDVMSAELIGKVDLDAGEEKELEVVLKPKEEGEVPLKVKLKYKDLKGRKYESERVFLINVSDAEREEREEGRKEPSINIEREGYMTHAREVFWKVNLEG